MCGIVGYVGTRDAVPVIIEGLRKLEYRGYDSAGVAVVRNGQLMRRRAAGKLQNLEESLKQDPLSGDQSAGDPQDLAGETIDEQRVRGIDGIVMDRDASVPAPRRAQLLAQHRPLPDIQVECGRHHEDD